jgi:hypothetical protein
LYEIILEEAGQKKKKKRKMKNLFEILQKFFFPINIELNCSDIDNG